MPFSRRLSIITPPSHCGGVFAAGQVHWVLTGMSEAVISSPLTAKVRFSTIACERLWSKAACVVASRLAVVSVPPNILPEGRDLVKKPPLEGKLPVSLRMPFIPLTVPVTEIARPLKLVRFGVGVGDGVTVGVGVSVGVGVGVADGVGVAVGVGVADGVGVAVGVGVGTLPHRARTFAAWNVLAARKVKSTARFGSIGINVTVTGL